MIESKRNGSNGSQIVSGPAPSTEVEYVKLSDRQVLIRTIRPGEEPVETVAALFPSRNGTNRE